MCECAKTVFVFEDVTGTRVPSPHTRVITKDELVDEFAKFGFDVEREQIYRLLEDEILFVKFQRSTRHRVLTALAPH